MKFLKKTESVVVDEKIIHTFLTRGVEKVFPSKESFAQVLSSGNKISIYLGIDPTGPTLHMGHAIPLMKLAELQKMGHKIILLVGDFTAMIGDPTDKTATRKTLTKKEVLANLKSYKKQASTFLSFGGSNPAEIKYNSTWLEKMSFAEVITLASHMTVQQMIERDMFSKRIKEGKPIHVHEFLYPLMQGFDSVAMDVDAEIGGNDQTFNMLAGRNLLRTIKNKEKFVLATKLLTDPTGKKMGKSEGNMITMADPANDMFGKVMSWPDELILSGFELCTRITNDDIEKEKSFLDSGGNPRDAKMRLGLAVVEVYHGKDAALHAKDSFVSTFSSGTMQNDAPEVVVTSGEMLSDILMRNQIISSKTEFKRLVSEKAIKELGEGTVIETFDFKVTNSMNLKIGKHRFLKIKV